MQKPAVLIDTNIFIDVFLQRSPFFDDARDILKLCEEQEVHGFLTAFSITAIFYILKRSLHDTEASYEALGAILSYSITKDT